MFRKLDTGSVRHEGQPNLLFRSRMLSDIAYADYFYADGGVRLFIKLTFSRAPRSGDNVMPALFFLGATIFLAACAPTAGDLVRGEYAMSQAELNMHCGALENAIQAIITRIGSLQSTVNAEDSVVAPTVTRFWIRVTEGVRKDSPSLQEIAWERERAKSYNARLQSKGCSPVDLESKLGSL